MKFKKIFIRVASVALSLLMLLTVASCAASDAANGDGADSETIEVVVFTKDVEYATKITKEDIAMKTITLPISSITIPTRLLPQTMQTNI